MSSKEVKIRVTGDVSDLLKKLEMVKDSFDDLNKGNTNNNKSIKGLFDDLSDVDKKIEKTVDSMDDLADATGKVGKKNITGIADDLSDTNKKIDNTVEGFKDLNKQINDVDAKPFDAIDKQIASLYETTNSVKDAFSETFDIFDDFTNTKNKIKIDFVDDVDPDDFFDNITSGFVQGTIIGKAAGDSISNSFEGASDSIKELIYDQEELNDKIKDYIKLYKIQMQKDFNKNFKDNIKDMNKAQDDILKSVRNSDSTAFDKAFTSWEESYKKYQNQLNKIKDQKAPIEEQIKAYKQLEQESLKFINNEKNHAAIRKKVADHLEDARQAMIHLGVELDDLPKDVFDKLSDDLNKFTEESKNSTITTKKLGYELSNLDKSLSDKFVKNKINDDSFKRQYKQADEMAESFEKASKDIVNFANESEYAIKRFKVNGEVFETVTKDVEKFNDSLDNKRLEEMNNSLKEYLALVKETGGQVSERYLRDDGKIDADKYFEDYEKYGKPIAQLSMQFQSLKQKTLEYLQVEENSLEDKAKYIKMVNEQAKSLRKLGTAAEDIKLSDIEDFDKSLASNLNNNFKDLFDNDIPGNFKEIKDELKAAFDEFNNLELGNAFDLLKNAGKGIAKNIFSKIPTQVKLAAAAIVGLTYVTNKLYEAGKQQFFEGLANIGNKLQPVINAIQSFGREVISAFEEITNTQIDLSSLMVVGPEFEYQMQRVGSIAGSNDKQLQQLTDTAERLGGTTQFTASQVGEAFEYMAMAGYDTEEMLASIDDTLNLAKIAGTDLGTVSDIVTDGLTSMGMSAADTGEFVDKLTATITSSNTNVELFGNTLKQVGSLAGSLGIDMTDLSTAIGLAANAGIKGERAGTSLKNVLSNMAAPTKEQAAALEKLGLTADKTGSYLKTTADGNVDLAATMKSLMKATEGMTNTQKAAILTQIAGKEAVAGLMSIMNQGEAAWDELSTTIENSTGKVQYWNECMSLAGKSGKEASKLIEQMKKVFSETEAEASALGLSTDDLAHSIAALGDDGKVTTGEVRNLLKVIESMNNATGKKKDKWIELGVEADNDFIKGFDYDGTIANITADTQGLTQAQKEELKTRLKNVKTYKDAKEAAKQYQTELREQYGSTANLTDIIKRNDLASTSYIDKLKYLKDIYTKLGPKAFEAEMANLGLGDSIQDIEEIVSNSDFDQYIKNLETVESMSEQLSKAMDETTKGSLLSLASAIQNVAIAAFNNLKPTINSVSEALTDFFDTWHNGDDNEFTFQGLENALHNLSSKILGEKNTIRDAIAGLFDGLDIFINEGAFQSILDIGTSVITGICDGIMKAKEDGSLDSAIDGAIKRICEWIEINAPQVSKAGKTIIDSLKQGIENNKDRINSALDAVMGVLKTWANSSSELRSTCLTFAGKFIDFAIEGIKLKAGEFAAKIPVLIGQWIRGLLDGSFLEDAKEIGVNIVKGIIEGITGCDSGEFDSAAQAIGKIIVDAFCRCLGIHSPSTVMRDEVGKNITSGIAEGLINGITEITDAIGKVIDAIKDGFKDIWNKIFGKDESSDKELLNIDTAKLEENKNALKSLGDTAETVREQVKGAFTSIANITRNQFVNVANIVRNQMLNSANIVRNQAVNMSNIFRNQFVSMANVARNQMVNVSNIIRNQAVSWSNIIRNQAQNARNTLTSSFISMRNVARTQMVSISNIIRNQSVNWANIIRNQAANARNALTGSFMSMAAVVRNQMANCLSIVRSYMSQIKAATSQQMTMHFQVSKTVTTTNVTKNVTEGLRNTMGAISRGSTPLAAPQAMSIGGYATSMSSIGGLAAGGSLSLSIPLYLNGKEIARASATYNEEELAKLAKRNNRKRGE